MTATDLDHVSFCVLVGDDKMLTVNQLRNMHHAVFAKRNAYWRDAFQREAETQQALLDLNCHDSIFSWQSSAPLAIGAFPQVSIRGPKNEPAGQKTVSEISEPER